MQIRVPAQLLGGAPGKQPGRGAVHAAGKRYGDGLPRGHGLQPLLGGCQPRSHIGPPRRLEIRRAHAGRGVEEPPVSRNGIGAAHLIDLHQIVRRHHARVGGIELPADPLGHAPCVERVDAVGHHEEGPVVHLRHEIAQRQADGARQPHRLALAGHGGEVAVRCGQPIRVAALDGVHDVALVGSGQAAGAKSGQVDESIDAFEHEGDDSAARGLVALAWLLALGFGLWPERKAGPGLPGPASVPPS